LAMESDRQRVGGRGKGARLELESGRGEVGSRVCRVTLGSQEMWVEGTGPER